MASVFQAPWFSAGNIDLKAELLLNSLKTRLRGEFIELGRLQKEGRASSYKFTNWKVERVQDYKVKL